MTVDVVILAAGHSRRYAEGSGHANNVIPKALRRFHIPGMPDLQAPMMWEHVILGFKNPRSVMLTLRKDHLWAWSNDTLTALTLNAIDNSRGQADTLWQSIGLSDDPLLVVNCDQGFAPWVLNQFVLECSNQKRVGALVFEAGPEEAHRWSYVDATKENSQTIRRAAEKEAIGAYAMAGAYYFHDRWVLKKALEQVVIYHRSTLAEPYISHAFSAMGAAGYGAFAYVIDRSHIYDWGTLELFEKWKKENIK